MVRRCSRDRRERGFTRGMTMCNSRNGKKNSLCQQRLCNAHLPCLLSHHGQREQNSFRISEAGSADEITTRLEWDCREKQRTGHGAQYVLCWGVRILLLEAMNRYERILSRVVTRGGLGSVCTEINGDVGRGLTRATSEG